MDYFYLQYLLRNFLVLDCSFDVRQVLYSYQNRIDPEIVKMNDTATLSNKFQISIPKAVRDAHNWKAGQEFAFIPRGSSVMLVPVPELEDLLGALPNANPNDYRDRNDRY